MDDWKTPSFVEVPMNAEIGAYSDMLTGEPPVPRPVEPAPPANGRAPATPPTEQ